MSQVVTEDLRESETSLTVRVLINRLLGYNPEAKLEFLTLDIEWDIASIYSEKESPEDMLVCIDFEPTAS